MFRIIDETISNDINTLRKAENIQGVSITLVKPDGLVEFGSWGVASEQGTPMSSNILFNIGSCSKAFLAASLAILIEDFAKGRNIKPLPPGLSEFNWETKVIDLLPGHWIFQDTWARTKANLRDILSHVTGLPRSDNAIGHESSVDLIARLRYLRPIYELRQSWCYSNIGYIVGAHIISEYSGVPYQRFARERLFLPLSMKSTGFLSIDENSSDPLSHAWTVGGRRLPYWFEGKSANIAAGPAGVVTNAVDLSIWLKFHLNGGIVPGTETRLIPKSSYEVITTAYAIVNGKSSNLHESVTGYGIGWQRMSYYGHEVLDHGGLIPGFGAYVAFFPNDNMGIAVTINTYVRPSLPRDLSLYVVKRALDIKAAQILSYAGPNLTVDHYLKNPLQSAPSLEKYAGAYTNAGYGTLTLCSQSCTSGYCKSVLSEFATVERCEIDKIHRKRPAQLVARWPRLWTSHVRFVHVNGNILSFQPASLFPTGYGADRSPFEIDYSFLDGDLSPYAEVEFVHNEGLVVGFGIFGFVPSDVRLRRGEPVAVDSLAFFKRVGGCPCKP